MWNIVILVLLLIISLICICIMKKIQPDVFWLYLVYVLLIDLAVFLVVFEVVPK